MTDQDKHLVQEAKAGNKRAFGKLVKKHQNKILFLSHDLIGNYEDAKDLAQETFIRSFEKLSQFQERAQFSTWLYRITVNLAMDFHRRRVRNRHQSLETGLTEIDRLSSAMRSSATSDHLINEMEHKALIEIAINKLSMNQRTATALKYFHHKTTKEIAEIMGCAEGTVRNHLSRAMSNLKKHLGELL